MRDVAAVERELEAVAQRRDVLGRVTARASFGEREAQQNRIGWGRALEQRDGVAEARLLQQEIGIRCEQIEIGRRLAWCERSFEMSARVVIASQARRRFGGKCREPR